MLAPRSSVRAAIPFRAIGLLDGAPGARVRASADAVHWTEWQTAGPGDGAGSLVYFGGLYRFVQLDSAGDARVLFIDPGVTPAHPPTGARPLDFAQQPAVVTRAQWGCTPQTCPTAAPPEYTTVTHLIVHHTDDLNYAADWAAVVRAIWVLHVHGNGWNDIGYNYLIDPNGVLYEGRAGGDGVVGAHFSCVNGGTMGVALLGTFSVVPPTDAAIDMLRRMLVWQAARWNLDPTGRQLHGSSGLMLNTISGHRDANLSAAACGPTECPGNDAYVELPAIRALVGQTMTGDCPIAFSERNFCAPATGATWSATATTPSGCSSKPSAGAAWLSVVENGGALQFTAQPNSGARRSTAVTVAGHALTITQSGGSERSLPCIAFDGVTSAGADSGRPLVAGSLISIFGSNLATQTASAPSTGSLPPSLGGVSVAIDGRAAPVSYVSAGQINAQTPAATNIGSGTVTVTVSGTAGPSAPLSVSETVPALFSIAGRAIARNDSDGSVNGPSAPASPGGGVTLYLTGITASTPIAATIGRQGAYVGSLVRTGVAGVYALDLQLPLDAAPGDQPVIVTAIGVPSTPATVTIAPVSARIPLPLEK